MPRSMIPFPYSPWPFLDFGSDPDPNGTPQAPNVPGVTIPWSTLPPIAPPPWVPSPVVPPPEAAREPPPPTSETPGFDRTFTPQPPPAPPVAQPPRNPGLADIIAPWIQPPAPEPPPLAFSPSETPGFDKAIARINAPTPGFHLTPGLGGFTQRAADATWSLPPPPVLLPMSALAKLLPVPPPMPAPSPLILAGNPSAPAIPQPGVGPGIPETLGQMARRLMPYATDMGAAIGRTLPSVGAAGAGAVAAAPILLAPSNTQSVGTIDLGDGLRTNLPPGQRYVPIERRVAPGVFGSDVGATWKPVPGLYGEVDPGRGVRVDPDRLREALGEEAANRILNTPGIMPMAKPESDRQVPRGLRDQNTTSSGGDRPPEEPTPPAEAIVDHELRRLARIKQPPTDSTLDPKNMNAPISDDERLRAAKVLAQIASGNTSGLKPHPYRNFPHRTTGAALPSSNRGYIAYDVRGLGQGRGVGRLIIENGTGRTYYTNSHYLGFYSVEPSTP